MESDTITETVFCCHLGRTGTVVGPCRGGESPRQARTGRGRFKVVLHLYILYLGIGVMCGLQLINAHPIDQDSKSERKSAGVIPRQGLTLYWSISNSTCDLSITPTPTIHRECSWGQIDQTDTTPRSTGLM